MASHSPFPALAILLILIAPVAARPRGTMLSGVYTGYQGWFDPVREEDGARWIHYGHRGRFEPGFSVVEMWPDVSGFDEDEKVPTGYRHPDGSVACVFDSGNPKTVRRHFGWMSEYGIDGAFLQRFVSVAANPRLRPPLDRVLANVRESSKSSGVAWGLMYDLSGVRGGDVFRLLRDDWTRLAVAEKIRDDPHYIRHRDRPVVVIWGIGFREPGRPAPGDFLPLIEWLKHDPEAGGNTVILGVPFYWRSGRNDAVDDPALHEVIRAADVVAPWPVGRYGSPEDAARLARTERAADVRWAEANGLDYLPGIFPGFSWHHLQKSRGKKAPFNQIPRLQGRFLWTQAVSAKEAGAQMLYVAMFDEIDEGTAIFRIDGTPPAEGGPFLTNEGLPPDHYLWLTGTIARMLRGEIPATPEPPQR